MQGPNAGPKPVPTPKEKKIKEKTGSGKNILVGLYKNRSHPEVFLGKSVLKICSKFTGEHPCRSVMLIKLLCNQTWNHTSALAFTCKVVAYFQNTFS